VTDLIKMVVCLQKRNSLKIHHLSFFPAKMGSDIRLRQTGTGKRID